MALTQIISDSQLCILVWQSKLPTSIFAQNVVVEEVNVKASLDDATNVHHPVVLIVRLMV